MNHARCLLTAVISISSSYLFTLLIILRSLDQIEYEVNATTTIRHAIANEVVEQGWEMINKQQNNFVRYRCDPSMTNLLFRLRAPQLSLTILLRFLHPQLLERIWNGHLEDNGDVWVYKTTPKNKTINSNKFSLQLIFSYKAAHSSTSDEDGQQCTRGKQST